MGGISKKVMARISAINGVISQYGQVTIRQIYYRLLGVLPVNYRQVIYACKVGRQNGLISWNGIVDRARPSYSIGQTFEKASDFIDEISGYFHLNYWAESNNHVEIWTEKDALSQILYKIAERYHVTVRVTRGFLSLSNKVRWGGNNKTILYFGDHDPSGLYIDEDLKWEVVLENFKRIALDLNQITEHNLPPIKVNKRDPRSGNYIYEYGNEGWEIDALPPDYLENLVRTAIEEYVDFDLQQKKDEEEKIIIAINDMVDRIRDS